MILNTHWNPKHFYRTVDTMAKKMNIEKSNSLFITPKSFVLHFINFEVLRSYVTVTVTILNKVYFVTLRQIRQKILNFWWSFSAWKPVLWIFPLRLSVVLVETLKFVSNFSIFPIIFRWFDQFNGKYYGFDR